MLHAGWLLTPQRVAVAGSTAVVADLHLGYAHLRQRAGEAVPLPHLAEELQPLAEVVQQHGIRQILVAGDLFEDGRHARTEMEADLLAWCEQHGVVLQVVPGNHDHGLADSRLQVLPEAKVGEWRVVHGDGKRPDGPVIQGHEHPWIRWRPGVEGPCYLLADDHLVLPAFSTNAAGVQVRGVARWVTHRAAVIAGDRVLDFGLLGQLPNG
jgi:putative SbcD/Mre11-related phosphoesterase